MNQELIKVSVRKEEQKLDSLFPAYIILSLHIVFIGNFAFANCIS